MTDRVDVVVLSRGDGKLDSRVEQGLADQGDLGLQVLRVHAPPELDDAHRWQTIARGRNRGKRLGQAPWLMFLDDDVVLPPGCIATLLGGLKDRPIYGALAADYLEEGLPSHIAAHVGMGATLFRRAALDTIEFRSTGVKCECQCACDDLRANWIAIDYLTGQTALHLPRDRSCRPAADGLCDAADSGSASAPPGMVLAAFDDRHSQRFRDQFVASLRRSGNQEPVIAVAYELSVRERRELDQIPNLTVAPRPSGNRSPAARRLRDFAAIVESLPSETPVAYWDAGDVIFQGKLAMLWTLVCRYPEKLLVVAEPFHHPQNRAVAAWTRSIEDVVARNKAFDLLSTNLCLNGGFAAGTARVMLGYLRAADSLLHSAALQGSTDWGDQTALNLYCHSNPQAWRQIEEGWNYCLCGRPYAETYVCADGRVSSRKGTEIRVIHGNAQTLSTLRVGELG